MEDNMNRLLDLQEKIFDGTITEEELKEYNDIISRDDAPQVDKSSNPNTVTFDDKPTFSFDSKLSDSITSSFKSTTESLKSTLFPKVEEKTSELLEQAKRFYGDAKPMIPTDFEDVKAKTIDGASKLKERIKSIPVPQVPFTQKNCNHELFYLTYEVPTFNYESLLFKSCDNHRCICKCLNCGKEITTFKSNLGCNVIIESEDIRSEERYNKARKHYLSLKLHRYSGQSLMDALYSELEKDRSDNNVPKLKL